MNTQPTKADKRAELNAEMERFLAKGGKVDSVPQGISGRENPEKALTPALFAEKASARTDARNALKSLDARKASKTSQKSHKRPTKKPVYDDFGELLRWVWVDE
ncbi:hypothetical protein NBRC116188_02680 [Oceaniserpentilla sp. 4NH20-0058]|uniref:hypothetical protein n=1 Tax=Oceaniserpentilla sp. 4NH20-0058 TaxID=3127660 RepID=UPI00310AF6F8